MEICLADLGTVLQLLGRKKLRTERRRQLDSSQSFFQAGCFSAGCYRLSSAVYTSTASDNAAATLTSLATATGSSTQPVSNSSNTSGSSNYLGASSSGGGSSSYVQASSVTYTRSSNQTQTQGSTASSTFSEQGTYYGGNYAFSDVFYEVQNTSNATALLSATNSFTETLSNGTTSSASGGGGLLQGYLSSTSQGTFGSGSGQSVTGSTLDCYTSSDYASNSSTLTEQGNFANGSYNLRAKRCQEPIRQLV